MKTFKTLIGLVAVLLGFTAQVNAQEGAAEWVPDPDKEYLIKSTEDTPRFLTYVGTNGGAYFNATVNLFNQAWRFIAIAGDGNDETTEYYIVSSKINTDVINASLESLNEQGISRTSNSGEWQSIRVFKDNADHYAIKLVGSDATASNQNRSTLYRDGQNLRYKTVSPNPEPPTEDYVFILEEIDATDTKTTFEAQIAHAQAVIDEVTAQKNAGITVFGMGGRYQDETIYNTLASTLTTVLDNTANITFFSIHNIWSLSAQLDAALNALFASAIITEGDYYLRIADYLSNVVFVNSNTSWLRQQAYNSNAKNTQVFTFLREEEVENGPVLIKYKGTEDYYYRGTTTQGGLSAALTDNDRVNFFYDISNGKYALQSLNGVSVYWAGSEFKSIAELNYLFSIVKENIADNLYTLQTAVTAAQTAVTTGADYSYALEAEMNTLLAECQEILKYKYDVPIETITAKREALSALTSNYLISRLFVKNTETGVDDWVNKIAGSGTIQSNADHGRHYGSTNANSIYAIGSYNFSQGLDTIIVRHNLGNNSNCTFEIYAGDYNVNENKIATFTNTGTGWFPALEARTSEFSEALPADGILPIYVKALQQTNIWSIKFAVKDPEDLTIKTTDKTIITKNDTYINITVEAGGQLTVDEGVTITAESLTLTGNPENGMATFIDKGTATIPVVNVEQTLSTENGRSWYYLASPVTAASSGLFGNDVQIGSYDETTGDYTAPFAEATSLVAGKGYVVCLKEAVSNPTYTFSGALNNGAISIPLTRGEAGRGFNLVGNPYPSYLDWDEATKTNIASTIWTRSYTGSAMQFYTYNADAQISTDEGVTAHIAPLQAFWVRVSEGNTAVTLELTNDLRLHKAEGDANLRAAKDTRQLLRLSVSNGTNTDNTVILFDDRATNDFDPYDSEKMSNNNDAIPEIYTLAGTEALAINTLTGTAENSELPLGFKTKVAGTFNISINKRENIENVTLIDNGTEIDLTTGSHAFTSDITDAADRFVVALRASKTQTGLQNAATQSLSVYAKDSRIIVHASGAKSSLRIQVFNAAGQKLAEQLSNNVTTLIDRTFEAGIYLVKINGETRKIIVK